MSHHSSLGVVECRPPFLATPAAVAALAPSPAALQLLPTFDCALLVTRLRYYGRIGDFVIRSERITFNPMLYDVRTVTSLHNDHFLRTYCGR